MKEKNNFTDNLFNLSVHVKVCVSQSVNQSVRVYTIFNCGVNTHKPQSISILADPRWHNGVQWRVSACLSLRNTLAIQHLLKNIIIEIFQHNDIWYLSAHGNLKCVFHHTVSQFTV